MPFLPRTDQDLWQKPCNSPEHNPPGMIVLPTGSHTWQCPACGHETTFYVAGVTC